MPSHRCQHPTCCTYLPARGFCEEHKGEGQDRHAYYDRHQRDPEARSFYNSAAWKRTRANVLAHNPVCQRCGVVFAQHVHHLIPVRQADAIQRLDPALLMPVCVPCHNALTAEEQRKGRIE